MATDFQQEQTQTSYFEFTDSTTAPVNSVSMTVPKGKRLIASFSGTLFGESKAAVAIGATYTAAAALHVDGLAIQAPFEADVSASGKVSLTGSWPLIGLEGARKFAVVLTNDGTSQEMTCPCSTLTVTEEAL